MSRYEGKKARVRRIRIPLVLESNTHLTHCWRASRPGEFYLVGNGMHFDDWADAIAYATGPRSAS